MTRVHADRALCLTLLALALIGSGCAKKKAEAPPETAPPPAEAAAETTSQAPPSEPETPTPTQAEQGQWQDAFFDYDKYDLRGDAREALDHDAKVMRDNSGTRVLIEGHCDERGTTEYNLALGERRAAAARDYLTAAGIDAGRLDVVSYGEERPFATGHDEDAWAQNRRAHLLNK